MSKPWYSKCGHWISRVSISWGILFKWKMSVLPQTDNQNLHVSNTSDWLLIWPLLCFPFSKFSHLPSFPQAFSEEPVSPASPHLGEHYRDLSHPFGMLTRPPITDRWHGKMLCESKEKSKQLEILPLESRQPGPPGPLASADSRPPGLSHDLSLDSGWSVFSIKCSEVSHTRLGLDNLAKPILFSFSFLNFEAFCFPSGELPYEEFWNPGTARTELMMFFSQHSFIQQTVLKHIYIQSILIMMAY